MSYRVTAWVLQHSEAKLAARLVLLAMSEVAHDDGGMSFQKVETLAHKSRIGESTARGCLRRLEADGRIENTGVTAKGTVIYRIKMDDAPEMGGQNLRGPESSARGPESSARGPESGPEPLGTTTNHPRSAARARARPTIAGKCVSPEAWALTGLILVEFNRQTGRDLRLMTSGGVPSSAARRIYMRVAAYPDLKFDDHRRIIEVTLASKWWWHGKASGDRESIGVVYGPEVFEENISRKPPKRSAREQEEEQQQAEMIAAMKRRRGMADEPILIDEESGP